MQKNPAFDNEFNLYLFPFAGASFYSYNSLIKDLKRPDLKITTLELPGRGKRMKEPLLSDINDMADDLFHKIKTNLNYRYAFYGHSLGSLVAHKVVLRILDNGMAPPVHLFVSGRGGPGVLPKDRDMGSWSRERFYEKLKTYGGTPPQVLQEKELMAFLEPVLRADFTAAGNYEPGTSRKLPVTLTVLNGIQDDVTREEALQWQEVTDTPIVLREFSGDHFFIFDQTKAVGDVILQGLLGN